MDSARPGVVERLVDGDGGSSGMLAITVVKV